MTFLLFDEIEKSSDALWQLSWEFWTRALDSRRQPPGRPVPYGIVMTSNLGADDEPPGERGYRVHLSTG